MEVRCEVCGCVNYYIGGVNWGCGMQELRTHHKSHPYRQLELATGDVGVVLVCAVDAADAGVVQVLIMLPMLVWLWCW